MKTLTESPRIFVFSAPAPELLMSDTEEYYRECRLAGAGSVEVQLPDHSAVIISATRYLAPGVEVTAAVSNGMLQVLCTRLDGRQIVMREFSAWTSYTVHRAHR